jgi:hypothetical protein
METFKTNFMMSGVATDVTVKIVDEKTFACTVNLVDFFEGGENEDSHTPPDVTLQRDAGGRWQIVGESNMSFTEHDLQNLQKAIETDYLNAQKE